MNAELTGGGNPERTAALLWGPKAEPKRGRKRSLDPALIGSVAVALADRAGLAGLSMRGLAETLGVSTMALYRYVPGRAELIDLMLDTAYGELRAPATARKTWRCRVECHARAEWALYLAHPWMLQVSAHRPVLGPNALAKYEFELKSLDDTALTDLDRDLVIQAVSGYVRACARSVVDARLAEIKTGLSDAQWWAEHSAALAARTSPSQFPRADRVGMAAGEAYGAVTDPERVFEFGLSAMLDGIATKVRLAATPRRRGEGPR
jgi:AcrR family transcriptional regulator